MNLIIIIIIFTAVSSCSSSICLFLNHFKV